MAKTDAQMQEELVKVESTVTTEPISSANRNPRVKFDMGYFVTYVTDLLSSLISNKANIKGASLTEAKVNNVTLTNEGDATKFLNEQGEYVENLSGGGGTDVAYNGYTYKEADAIYLTWTDNDADDNSWWFKKVRYVGEDLSPQPAQFATVTNNPSILTQSAAIAADYTTLTYA